jgi:hypothetical protein
MTSIKIECEINLYEQNHKTRIWHKHHQTWAKSTANEEDMAISTTCWSKAVKTLAREDK